MDFRFVGHFYALDFVYGVVFDLVELLGDMVVLRERKGPVKLSSCVFTRVIIFLFSWRVKFLAGYWLIKFTKSLLLCHLVSIHHSLVLRSTIFWVYPCLFMVSQLKMSGSFWHISASIVLMISNIFHTSEVFKRWFFLNIKS